MSDEGKNEKEAPKLIPTLSKAQEQIAYGRSLEDPAIEESLLFNSGKSSDDLEKQAVRREADRAEKFKDNFEYVSIFGLYFLSVTAQPGTGFVHPDSVFRIAA